MAKVRINEDRCKGCFLCLEVCPRQVLVIKGQLNKRGVKPATVKNEAVCIGCCFCALMCPESCIEVEK